MSDATFSTLMDEHAPRTGRNADEKREYTPSEDELKVIKFVMEKFRRAKRHRDKYDVKWLDYYKMFRGKQWPNQRPTWRHSDVVNMIFQAVQSMSPLETDSRPKFQFIPEEPSDTEVAEILNEVCESDWERNNWLMTMIEVVFDKYIYGTGLSSMEWNEEGNDGAGIIEYLSTDPFHVFPDPDARDVNVDSDCFLTVVPWQLEKAKKKWPDKAEFLKCDTFDVYGGDKQDLLPDKIRSNIDRRMIYEETTSVDSVNKDYVLVFTLYCKPSDYDEVEEFSVDQSGAEQKRYVQKLKWPNGRKIVIANNLVLEDDKNPYDDGLFPFSRCQNYMLPREFWGLSEIEPLEGPQKIFNKLICFCLDILTLTGNPILRVDSTSGLDTDNLFNRPGDIWEIEPNSKVEWLQPAQLHPAFLQLIDRMKNWFDQLSGANDVTRGVNPTGITAMGAIEALQEAAQTRTRQKLRLIDCYLKDSGRQYKNRVFQFYTVPRLFRLTNKQGLDKYFKFHVTNAKDQDGNETGQKVVRITPFVENAGQYSEGQTKEFVLNGDLDCRTTTGSELPFSKDKKEQRLMKLFELGVIDQEELLKGMEYPNAEIVIQRMKAAQAQQAQAMPPQPQQGAM